MLHQPIYIALDTSTYIDLAKDRHATTAKAILSILNDGFLIPYVTSAHLRELLVASTTREERRRILSVLAGLKHVAYPEPYRFPRAPAETPRCGATLDITAREVRALLKERSASLQQIITTVRSEARAGHCSGYDFCNDLAIEKWVEYGAPPISEANGFAEALFAIAPRILVRLTTGTSTSFDKCVTMIAREMNEQKDKKSPAISEPQIEALLRPAVNATVYHSRSKINPEYLKAKNSGQWGASVVAALFTAKVSVLEEHMELPFGTLAAANIDQNKLPTWIIERDLRAFTTNGKEPAGRGNAVDYRLAGLSPYVDYVQVDKRINRHSTELAKRNPSLRDVCGRMFCVARLEDLRDKLLDMISGKCTSAPG